MDSSRDRKGSAKAWELGLAALGYFLSLKISYLFPDASHTLMLFWPAAGVGLAAFLLIPRASWPILAIIVFVVGNLSNLSQGRPLLGSLGWMSANVLESWLCASFIFWKGSGRGRFDSFSDMLALVFASTVVNGLTALIGAGTATLVTGADFGASWFSWWVSDGLGLLLVAPLIVAWRDLRYLPNFLRPTRVPEFLSFMLIWIAFSWLGFNNNSFLPLLQPHPYLLALLIAWPAIRFSLRSISLALNLLTILAITSEAVILGPSPIHGEGIFLRQLYVESFVAILGMTSYLLYAAFHESQEAKKKAEEGLENLRAVEYELRGKEARYRGILENAGEGILLIDLAGQFLDINEVASAMLGYGKDELLGMRLQSLDAALEPDQPSLPLSKLDAEGAAKWERRLRRRDGRVIDTETSARGLEGGLVVCIVLDVTKRRLEDRMTRLRLDISEASLTSDLDRVLTLVLDAAEAETGSKVGFYHLLAENQVTITLQSWSTNTLARMCSAEGRGQHYPIDRAGVWVDAVRERRPVIHNDYYSLAGKKGFPEGHSSIIRELIIPIVRKGLIVGILGVGNKTTDYDEYDIEKLVYLGDLSWDFVERKHTQDLLRETEERFAAIFKGSPLPTSLSKVETGSFIDVNEAFLELFGYDRNEVIGHSSIDLRMYWDPDDRARLISKAMEAESSFKSDLRVRNKQGEAIDTLVAFEVIHIRGEHYLVTQIQDYTEQRRAEQALRSSEANLRVAQEVAKIGNWNWDIQNNSLVWSEGMYRIFGVSPETFKPTAEAILPLIHPADRDRVVESTRMALSGPYGSKSIEYRVAWPDGSVHVVLGIPGETICDASGGPQRLSGIYQNITERKQDEEKILRALAEKEILLRELYHRSNNNMQIITALLEFQSEELKDERLTRALTDTQDRIGSIALVNRKLYDAQDLSHIDLKEYIEELARILSQSYATKSGQIALVSDLEEVRVLIDTAIPCGLILNELISNVFKHAYPDDRQGDIVITLRKASNGRIMLRRRVKIT